MIRKVLDLLKQQNPADNTLTIYATDHRTDWPNGWVAPAPPISTLDGFVNRHAGEKWQCFNPQLDCINGVTGLSPRKISPLGGKEALK